MALAGNGLSTRAEQVGSQLSKKKKKVCCSCSCAMGAGGSGYCGFVVTG